MKRLVLVRLQSLPDRTLGRLYVFNENDEVVRFCTLELPWKGNEQQVSCIPTGKYHIIPRTTAKRGDHIAVLNVPGRSDILIHAGNYPIDILGCILVGMRTADIDGDGKMDLSSSKSALSLLTQFVTGPATLTVMEL